MEAEIETCLKASEVEERLASGPFVFYRARLLGQEIVLVQSGIGKVFAAMVTQCLIDRFQPSCLLFTGVAGALNPAYEIGDVLLAKDCLQHDVDGRALGFERGRLLYTDHRAFACDGDLIRIALGARIEGRSLHVGRILTGDQFMTRREVDQHPYLTGELQGDAVEMEGAAVGQVCALQGLPFLLIRTLSDKADGDAPQDFERFLPRIAQNSFAVVRHILETRAREPG